MVGDHNVRQARNIRDLAISAIRSIEKNYETLISLEDGEEKISRKDTTNRILAPGNVVCLAAAPDAGSTAYLLRVLMSVVHEKEGVLLFSPRDPGEDLFLRLLACITGRDAVRLAEGRLMESEWALIIKCTEKLIDSSFQLHGNSPEDLTSVRKAIEAFPRGKGNLRLVILDDLFTAGCSDEVEGRTREEVLWELKEIAIYHNVAILFTWKIQHTEADKNEEDRMRSHLEPVPDKYHQFLSAVMTLRKDGRRHRLSLYDTDTGKRFAMRLTLLTGIGVMTIQ